MDEFVQPNWHVALVHFPIALLVIGTLIEIFSFAGWRRAGLRWAGRWMVLLGAVTAVPTAVSGLYALADVLPHGIAGLEERSLAAGGMVRNHLLFQSIATGLAMLIVTLWIAFSDLWRDRLNLLFKLGLLGVIALILAGSWQGGEMVYAYNIGTHNTPTTLPTTIPTTHLENHFAEMFPLVQTHIVMAGFALAMACVALGFSARLIAVTTPTPRDEDESQAAQRIARAFSQDVGSIGEPRNLAAAEQIAIRSPNYTPTPRVFPLWFLVSLLLLGSAAGGLWVLAHDLGTWDVDALRSAITQPLSPDDPKVTRRLVHAISGVTIVASALLLTLAGLAAPRSRLLLTILAVPMILAMFLQIWVGALMVLDGPSGRVTEMTNPL